MKQQLHLRINGEEHEVYAEPWETLQDVLRDEVGLTGVKSGCSTGNCGACTVLVDGNAVKSCLILAKQAADRDILTVEGLAKGGKLHPLQQAFIDHFAIQCGFCTPGMLLAAFALLENNPHATVDEIKHGMHGNLCRCTGYVKIIEAIVAAQEQMQKAGRQ